MRLFVAIALPDSLRQRLAALGGGVPGARWLTPDQMHLTLRFIGEVDGDGFDAVRTALTAVRAEPFDLSLDGLGHFGDSRRIRALWAGIADQPALDHLQRQIESVMVRAGFEPEARKFRPHVTLARLRNAPSGRISTFLTANGMFGAGPFTADHFHLYPSTLSASGAAYRVEESYALATPDP